MRTTLIGGNMPEVIHVFSERDSKGSLLAEVHRLQNSLAAMRQARDFHGANSAYLMQERDRLQEEIEMREEAPVTVDAGLVERMLIAWAHGDGDIKLDAINVRRMTAALRVAADALLGPVTDKEINGLAFVLAALSADPTPKEWVAAINEAILAARRARLLAPEKSLRRQIEENVHALCQLPMGSEEQNKCADFVLDLITMLKQESK